jgi:TRAP-type C4-dicarboxylate transport system permease small subunit
MIPEPLAPAPPPAEPTGAVDRIARGLAVCGGALLVTIAMLVSASVSMRWLGGQGVNGDFEMVQMGLALSVFAFLPLCQAHRGNVMVDTFTTRLPGKVQAAIDALWDLVYAGFAGFIAWRLAIGAWEAFESHTTSMVLGLPIHYAIGGCSGMAAFLAVICLATAFRRAKGHA